ncbi:YgfZ/GcvT domain-containing protein [Coralloluteibacterium thermophilus]|uniref:YgfZ/GcvT domain-containing protein n=1 Tax=Coralloluteibacterium thermophilum TaxID=2707049 RepID=A0ABV9NGP3_9GAMM
MPFNPNEAVPAAGALPFDVLTIAGADAVPFAQAQFTSDVAALRDGHWHWSAWLTPKGRVIALFALLRIDATTIRLLLPDHPAGALRERLQRFVFRSKVRLEVGTDLVVEGRVGGDFPTADGRSAIAAADDGDWLDLGGDGFARGLRIGAGARTGADPAFVAAWQRADIAHGLPRLGPDQSESWTPQMLGLDRLQAVSLRKGCYPGQEIVSRTHYLGQAKRGPVRLQVEDGVPGAEVLAEDAAVGQLVSVAGDEALAVVALDHAAAALRCGGRPCAALPFLPGLAR